jgi:tRNA U55 pseudouridine synthase TruB
LAFDLGVKLGCGGFLSGLRRTKVGEYDLKEAMDIHEFVLGINKANDSSAN